MLGGKVINSMWMKTAKKGTRSPELQEAPPQ